MSSFFEEGYEVPQSSGGAYFKPQSGQNRVRILSDAVSGWSYWSNDNKCFRTPKRPEVTPNIRVKDGKTDRVKHFLMMTVWDYASSSVKLWEITQSTIHRDLYDLDNSDWGHPKGYDIIVTKKGEQLNTEYSVLPQPSTPLTQDILNAWAQQRINLEEIFLDGNPMEPATEIRGAAGSWNESRALRILQRKLAIATAEQVEKMRAWANQPEKVAGIARYYLGDETKALQLIESLCQQRLAETSGSQVPVMAGASPAEVNLDDIPF
jgi:hypothetical protein